MKGVGTTIMMTLSRVHTLNSCQNNKTSVWNEKFYKVPKMLQSSLTQHTHCIYTSVNNGWVYLLVSVSAWIMLNSSIMSFFSFLSTTLMILYLCSRDRFCLGHFVDMFKCCGLICVFNLEYERKCLLIGVLIVCLILNVFQQRKLKCKTQFISVEMSPNSFVILQSTLHCLQFNVSWCTEIYCNNREVTVIVYAWMNPKTIKVFSMVVAVNS